MELLTFGSTTSPMANIPPPRILSRQCENIFFTFPDATSCESTEEFDCPKPIIPSRASSEDELNVTDCTAPHLTLHIIEKSKPPPFEYTAPVNKWLIYPRFIIPLEARLWLTSSQSYDYFIRFFDVVNWIIFV
ncbi:hypothetical protein JHK84_030803 [Glycine max]|nr:hypothetical protein JHK84_030803 [Glycine max]